MRKQNSTFKTAFLSEAGSALENNDYFAFVELERCGCYVIADGLNEQPGSKSAKLAIETVLTAFQEHPSMKKRALLSYIKAADRALREADNRERLKASVMIVVTDYEKVRYAYAGNTRLRLYRNGSVREQSRDTSLSSDIGRKEKLSEDILEGHEERNNLYSYVGKGKGFSPVISGKIKLEKGDILALYTRGIWENLDGGELDDVFSEAKDDPKECLDNIEDLLLSRQPKVLENYTFAAVFVEKVFLDPERKKKIQRIVVLCAVVLVVILLIVAAVWFLQRRRERLMEDMSRKYLDAIEYIQDGNFTRAKEEGQEALEYAEKLRDKKYIQEISDYLKLIEAVNVADEDYEEGKYKEAQDKYATAKERSRYTDHAADDYIDEKLEAVTSYLSVYDYIWMGDLLAEQGDYDRAEEKYLQARNLASGVYFEDGRKEAKEALEELYESRLKAEEEKVQAAEEKAAMEIGAVQSASEGDKAFAEGDYDGANAYFTMALEKYQELEDSVHAQLIQSKIDSCVRKAAEKQEKAQRAESYIAAGKEQGTAGNLLEAKKQYLFAKNIYKELGMDDKVTEVDGLMEILEVDMAEEAAEQAAQEAEREAAEKAAREAAEKELQETAEEALQEITEESLWETAGEAIQEAAEEAVQERAADRLMEMGEVDMAEEEAEREAREAAEKELHETAEEALRETAEGETGRTTRRTESQEERDGG